MDLNWSVTNLLVSGVNMGLGLVGNIVPLFMVCGVSSCEWCYAEGSASDLNDICRTQQFPRLRVCGCLHREPDSHNYSTLDVSGVKCWLRSPYEWSYTENLASDLYDSGSNTALLPTDGVLSVVIPLWTWT